MVARLFVATVAASLGLIASAAAQCPVGTACGSQYATGGCGVVSTGCATGGCGVATVGCNTGGCATSACASPCGTTTATYATTTSGRRGFLARRRDRGTNMVVTPTVTAMNYVPATTTVVEMPATGTTSGVTQASGTTPATGSAVVPATGTTPATGSTVVPATGTIVPGTQMIVPVSGTETMPGVVVYPMTTGNNFYYTTPTQGRTRTGLFGRIFRR